MQKSRDYFVQLHKEAVDKQQACKQKYSQISTLRILTFLAGMALLLIGVADNVPVAACVGALFIVGFCYLVVCHAKLDKTMKTVAYSEQVLAGYIARFGEEWREFSEDGSAYLDKEDTVASDIDLLGANSLYQLISTCHTNKGKKMLAEAMKLKAYDKDDAHKKSEAVKEIAKKVADFGIPYETAGLGVASKKKQFDEDAFEQFCKDDNMGTLPGWAKLACIFIPLLFVTSLILCLCGVFGYGLPLATFIILLAFTWVTSSVTNRVIMPLCLIHSHLDDYLEMMQVIENVSFESELLQNLREKICGDKGAISAFRALRGICQAYNISFNPLVHQICSGAFGWDYQLAHIAMRWKRKYGDQIGDCFYVLGKFEELLSLSVIAVVRDTCDGEIVEETPCKLACEDLYHPLIAPEKVIANSAKLASGITIITGSNMSGKTTFLRTIAVNLALAYMGAPVCGKRLQASYMKLFTSMRVTDDVAHGISTFYAEIMRIKAMADYKEQQAPMLCLIDEIFKGTNSADRIVGAKEAIRQLAGDLCMTIVSTHDFELCEIEDASGNKATNYHFEEYYEEGEDGSKLCFDYKIKNGRCTTTNARAILRMAGFVVQ